MKKVLAITAVMALAAAAWASPPQYEYEGKWGKLGDLNGEFAEPRGVAVRSNRNVYVTDVGNHRVQYFTRTGSFLGKWGKRGTGNGEFRSPYGVAVSATGARIYVADSRNHRIQYFKFANPAVSPTSLGRVKALFR